MLAGVTLLAGAAAAAERGQPAAVAPAALRGEAAKEVFGHETTPAPGPARAIGGYARGCLGGAVELPALGPHWEVMRPSRDRAWGHPALIDFLEHLAGAAARIAGWPGLLVGDIAQPRGGPMLSGHASHQIGLDADIWLTPMPRGRPLGREQREAMPATDVVAPGGLAVDRTLWRPQIRELLETAARSRGVARLFVNPAIKRALCAEAGGDRAWLRRIRPWWGHERHFHLRLACPPGSPQCRDQAPPPPGDGCGRQLAWWFTPPALHPKPAPPRPPLLLSQLPPACAALAR